MSNINNNNQPRVQFNIPPMPNDESESKLPSLPGYDVYFMNNDNKLAPVNPGQRGTLPLAPDNDWKEETVNGKNYKTKQINNKKYYYTPIFQQMPNFTINNNGFEFNLDDINWEEDINDEQGGSMNMNEEPDTGNTGAGVNNENSGGNSGQSGDIAEQAGDIAAQTGDIAGQAGNLGINNATTDIAGVNNGNLGNNDDNKQDIYPNNGLRGYNNAPGADIHPDNVEDVIRMNNNRMREIRDQNERQRRRDELLNQGINSRYMVRNMREYHNDMNNNNNNQGYFSRNDDYNITNSLVTLLGKAIRRSRNDDETSNIYAGCKWMINRVRSRAPNLYYNISQEANKYGHHAGLEKIVGEQRALFAFSPITYFSVAEIYKIRFDALFSALDKELNNENINIGNIKWLYRALQYITRDYYDAVTWMCNNPSDVVFNGIESITADKKFTSVDRLHETLKEYQLPTSLATTLGGNIMGSGLKNEYGGYVMMIMCKNIMGRQPCTHGKSGICKLSLQHKYGNRRHGSSGNRHGSYNNRRYNNYYNNHNNNNNYNGGNIRRYNRNNNRRAPAEERKENNN